MNLRLVSFHAFAVCGLLISPRLHFQNPTRFLTKKKVHLLCTSRPFGYALRSTWSVRSSLTLGYQNSGNIYSQCCGSGTFCARWISLGIPPFFCASNFRGALKVRYFATVESAGT